MRQFIEFIPVVLMAIVYFATRDIYISTAVLMVGVTVHIGFEYLRHRTIGRRAQVVFWAAIVFGGATLAFRNEEFIQWKPTVINWLLAGVLVGSQMLGRDNLLKQLLGDYFTLPDHVWRTLDLGWACGFFIAGVLNLVVAYSFSLDVWVTYKLVGGFVINIVYATIMMIYLVRGGHIEDDEPPTAHESD